MYVIGLLAILSMVPNCFGGQLYLRGNENQHPGHYLIVLRAGAGLFGAQQVENAAHQLSGVTIHRRYSVGNREFVKVSGDVASMSQLASLSTVAFIEPDHKVYLDKPVDGFDKSVTRQVGPQSTSGRFTRSQNGHPTCHADHVGPDGWGLIRTSYHSQPDYNNDPYVW